MPSIDRPIEKSFSQLSKFVRKEIIRPLGDRHDSDKALSKKRRDELAEFLGEMDAKLYFMGMLAERMEFNFRSAVKRLQNANMMRHQLNDLDELITEQGPKFNMDEQAGQFLHYKNELEQKVINLHGNDTSSRFLNMGRSRN